MPFLQDLGKAGRAFIVVAAVSLVGATATQAQPAATKASLSLPAVSVLFAPIYIAQDAGYFKDAGVDLDVSMLPGPAALNAVIGGSSEFAVMPGFLVIRAAQKGQKTLAIAGLQDRATTEIVLAAPVAEKLAAATTPLDRVKALKGLTLAVDAPNGLPHLWLRYVAKRAGINADKDIRLVFVAPPNMESALKKGDIDGFVFSSPFTLESVQKGAKMWVSAPAGDFAELNPTTYSILVAKDGYCKSKVQVCKSMVTALDRSLKTIKTEPEKSLALLAKRFERMDPQLLKQAFDTFQRNTPPQAMPMREAFDHTVETLFEADDRATLEPLVKTLYTDEFVGPQK